MKVNSFLWSNYLNTSGKKTITLFENLLNFDILINNYSNIKKELNKLYRIYDTSNNNITECFNIFKEYADVFFLLKEKTLYSIQTALETLYEELEEFDKTASDKLFTFISDIGCYTLALSINLPELFIPWFFQYSFNVFQDICDYFDIDIDFSKIPAKSDYRGRFMYYGDLCEALYDFRIENNFSPAELCAFLYDYAPKVVISEKTQILKITSEPSSSSTTRLSLLRQLRIESIFFKCAEKVDRFSDIFCPSPISQRKFEFIHIFADLAA